MAPRRDVQPDFEELCACFNRRGVEYLIVGSEAVAIHGFPRYSLDFDLAVEPTPSNAHGVFQALADFGFGAALAGHSPEGWIASRQVLQLGVKPNQVHILLEMSGISYEQAARDPVTSHYGQTPVRYIGYEALLQNKRAAGRDKDLADVRALERARRRGTPSPDQR